MSKTISTCICETNLVPNQPQENVFFHTLYRHKDDFTSEFIRTAHSTSPIQICALFSTQGPDNLGAFLNIELCKELESIVADISKSSVLEFDDFSKQVINRLNVKVCEFVVNNGGKALRASMTLVALEGDILRVISVGNTRAVLIREGRIFALNEEQTMAHRYVQLGAIPAEQEATHPENMNLTQYLGKMPQDGQVLADTKVHIKLKDNDEICIMGIGISKLLSGQLRNKVLVKPSTTEIKCKELVSAAFNSNVKSGLTAVAIKVESVFLLPGDAVIKTDPGHTVAPVENKKKESSDEGYIDFTKGAGFMSASQDGEDSATIRTAPAGSIKEEKTGEEGTTVMFNSGNIKAQEFEPEVKQEKKKKKVKASSILVPILIFILFAGIGFGGMFIAFNAVHLIDFFGDKEDVPMAEANQVLYAVVDDVPVYQEESLDSQVVTMLGKGTSVTKTSQGESFSKVVLNDGAEGYVLNAQLTSEDPSISVSVPDATEADQ